MFRVRHCVLGFSAILSGFCVLPADASDSPFQASTVTPTALAHEVETAEDVPAVTAGPIDLPAVRAEDVQREQAGLAPRYAIPYPVIISPDADGLWEQIDDQTSMWRIRISAPDALSVNLGFSEYTMPDGACLLIYSSDYEQIVRPFTAADNEDHGQLWTPVVFSDEVMVELTVPNAVIEQVSLQLTHIGYGYRGFGERAHPRQALSGSCNVDVVCAEGDDWRDEITSVGVISTGGSTFCTGFMVNNTAYDLRPYFMTAEHCGIHAGNAASLVVYWNYENSWCRPPGSPASGGAGDGTLNEFNTGSFFRASYDPSDMTLVELDDDPDPDWHVGFAGWNCTSADATSAVAIHHPDTDEKRISFEYDPTTTTSYLGYDIPGNGTHVRVEDWDLGTTEPGSSGSPLFNQDHQVIGQLHGGYASCSSQTSDWYGRFSVSWTGGGTPSTRLSDWLDAGGTGATTVDTVSGLGMAVVPGGDVLHYGEAGGPFTVETMTYTLSNPSPTPVEYEIYLSTFVGILLNGSTLPVSGTLAAGGGTIDLEVSLGTDIYNLPDGIYTEVITFDDLTNGVSKSSAHIVEVGQTLIGVTPEEGLMGSGPVGGPFPATQAYRITSERPTEVTVEISASASWISLNGSTVPISVQLTDVGDFEDIIVGFSQAAEQLPAGIHEGVVEFTNLSGGLGGATRTVTLDVGRVVYNSTDTPQPITDYSTTTSVIDVVDEYCIDDVDVDIDISHTYIGDLIVDLSSPRGTTIRLHDRTGGSSNDIVTRYDDDGDGTPPDGPGALSDFDLQYVTGLWTLTVYDAAGQDQGTLNSWSLRIAPFGMNCDCPADIDGDGMVNVTDLLALLAVWGPNPQIPADINGDGQVDVQDLLELLAAWGPC